MSPAVWASPYIPDDGRDFRTLYNYADRALYQAKSQGKDGYVVYDTANSRLPEETGYSLHKRSD